MSRLSSPSAISLPRAVTQLAQQLSESTSQSLFEKVCIQDLQTPLREAPIPTAFVTNAGNETASSASNDASTLPPILILHGFDSSLLEFRRLYPLLTAPVDEQPQREVWLIDLLGFGFSDRSPDLPFSPEAIKAHLLAFCQANIQRPVMLVGASMGGAAAIDFATSHPERVEQLVLLDSAGYQNGPIIGKYLFPPVDQWAVEILRKPGVRRRISCNAYANPDRLVTPDAECCAALHLLMPNWDNALKAFTKSGGYPKLRDRLPKVAAPTLVLWGKQDRILGTKDATRLTAALPNAQLRWIENSGHVPHLEQPRKVAQAIAKFAIR